MNIFVSPHTSNPRATLSSELCATIKYVDVFFLCCWNNIIVPEGVRDIGARRSLGHPNTVSSIPNIVDTPISSAEPPSANRDQVRNITWAGVPLGRSTRSGRLPARSPCQQSRPSRGNRGPEGGRGTLITGSGAAGDGGCTASSLRHVGCDDGLRTRPSAVPVVCVGW